MYTRYQRQRMARYVAHGFTLVELLIATGILLILLTLTVAVYSKTASGDRIRSSARQVQSGFGGARDRAIKAAKNNRLERRGLRLLTDPTDPSIVTSFVYVGNEGLWHEGQVLVGRADIAGGMPDGHADNPDVRTVRGYNTGWANMVSQGLLVNGARIEIPAGSGDWYIVDTSQLAPGIVPEVLTLTSAFQLKPVVPYFNSTVLDKGADMQYGIATIDDDGDGSVDNSINEIGGPNSDDTTDVNAFYTPFDYFLELKPNVLPGQEPLRLSRGIAIDLDKSKIPQSWFVRVQLPSGSPPPAANAFGAWSLYSSTGMTDVYRQYQRNMDVMFSPQGTVTGGSVSVMGTIHLRLAEIEDITLNRDPADPAASAMLYSTLFTKTGLVATFPVATTDGNSDGIADDPISFVRIGGTAGR
jgi:prepilin-type N-terminal cleavage/methylation domain-containing protein